MTRQRKHIFLPPEAPIWSQVAQEGSSEQPFLIYTSFSSWWLWWSQMRSLSKSQWSPWFPFPLASRTVSEAPTVCSGGGGVVQRPSSTLHNTAERPTTDQRGRGEPTWATMYSEAANTHRCPIYDTGPPLFSFGLNVHVKWTLNVDDRKFNFSSKGKSSNGSFVLHQARLNPWKTKHMHPCTNDPAPWY